MTVAMTAAGVARRVFRQFLVSKQLDVGSNGPFPCLKYPHPGTVEFLQRPATDAADHYRIDLVPAKTRYRVASPVLVDLILVVDRGKLAGDHVNHEKLRRRSKMSKHLTLQTPILHDRKTDFHHVPPV
jgi:hypothetical protein